MKARGIRCLKFFLILLNVFVIIFGLMLMVFCVASMRDNKARPADMTVSKGVYAFIITICLNLVVIGVLGIVGALRGHVKTLCVHVCFFTFLVTVELIVGVGGALISAWVGGGSDMRTQFYRNTTNEVEISKHHSYWDKIQSENGCCGVDGPQDYSILHRDIPPSCCARAHPLREGGARRQLHVTCLNDRTYYNRGCEEVLRYWKTVKGNIFISAGVIFTLFEIICVAMAIWLANSIRMERRELQQNLQAHFES